MEDLTIAGSFTPRRKITNIEDMTPRDWAEVTMDFLAFCKPFILGYNTEYYTSWYKSSLCFGPGNRGEFRELSEMVRCYYTRNCSQRVYWDKVVLPENIKWNTKVFRLSQYKNDMGQGQVKCIAITKDAQLLICKAAFQYPDNPKSGQDVACSTECTVKVANDENLTDFFTEEQTNAQDLLDSICTHAKDLIRLEQERITEEKVEAFTKAFEENIIARWGITT
jgi:hypothetical protein